MKKMITAIAAAGLLAPAIASAETLNYTYAQGGLAFYPSVGSQDLLGPDLRGAFQITPDIFAFGGLKYLTDDIDFTGLHVGAAYRFSIDQRTDVFGGLSIEHQKVEGRYNNRFCDGQGNCYGSRTVSDSDTSLGLRGGFRMRVMDELEVSGELRLVTGDYDYFGITAGAQYFITEELGLIGELDVWDGDPGIVAGARYNF